MDSRIRTGSVKATAPRSVTQVKARVDYNQITVTWEDTDADLYRVTYQDGKVFETPDRVFLDSRFTRGKPVSYRIEALGFGGTSSPVLVEAMPMDTLVLPPTPPL